MDLGSVGMFVVPSFPASETSVLLEGDKQRQMHVPDSCTCWDPCNIAVDLFGELDIEAFGRKNQQDIADSIAEEVFADLLHNSSKN
jgi:hypothetical protein